MERINLSKRIGRKTQFGQGMTEYIIIVALVAIGAIGVYNLFGKTVRDQTSAVAFGLAGNATSSTAQSKAAGTDATNAQTQADQTQGLDNFGQNAKDQ
jgi:type IV pilus assembly protein PilA